MGDSMTKLLEMLERLAGKLGTTVEELAPHVVEYTRVRAIGAACVYFIFAAIAIVGLVVGLKSSAKTGWDRPTPGNVAVITCVCWCIILILAGLIEGADTVAAILEPTGAVVKDLLNL